MKNQLRLYLLMTKYNNTGDSVCAIVKNVNTCVRALVTNVAVVKAAKITKELLHVN